MALSVTAPWRFIGGFDIASDVTDQHVIAHYRSGLRRLMIRHLLDEVHDHPVVLPQSLLNLLPLRYRVSLLCLVCWPQKCDPNIKIYTMYRASSDRRTGEPFRDVGSARP